MTTKRAAYSTLGLRLGAGRAEVNQAYRRLMKEHHPDRPGGDSDLAAEINRAYSLLSQRLGEPVLVPVRVPPRPQRSRWRPLFWLIAIVAIGTSIIIAGTDGRRVLARSGYVIATQARVPLDRPDFSAMQRELSAFEDPVQPAIVDKAVATALKFHKSGDVAGAAAYSSDCQQSLRREPNVAWFDTCAAFDEAMLALADDDNRGADAFDDEAVTIREVSSARLLSDDSFAADSRLHQIRSQVDFEILPLLDSAAAVKP
jgi:hypothetical protein